MQCFPHIVFPTLLLLPKLEGTHQNSHTYTQTDDFTISAAWHQKCLCVSWTPQSQRGMAAPQFSKLLRVPSPNKCKALSWSAVIPVPKWIVDCLHSFQQDRNSAVSQTVGHSSHNICILVLLWSIARSTKPSPTPPIYNPYPIELQ